MKERLEQRNGKAVAVAVAVENSARNITPNAPLTPHAIAPLTLSLPECLMEFCKVTLTFESVDEIL